MRYKSISIIAILLLAIAIRIQGQNKSIDEANAEIEKLKRQLVEANERARVAEAMIRKAQENLTRARYIAQAKAMAVKSQELGSDPEQEALVARLAYKFNLEYQGNFWDNDIYRGLNTALVRLHDHIVQDLQGHTGSARALISDSKSGNMYSGGADGRILRWTKQGSEWKADSISGIQETYQVYSIALSPDGNWLIAGGASSLDPSNGYVELFDLKNLKKVPKKISGFSEIQTLIYSSKGDGAYALEQNGTNIKFTDFKSAYVVIKPKEIINAIAISQDGSRLAGAGASRNLYVWDIANNYEERIAFRNTSDLTAVAFSPDNRGIVIGDEDGDVKVVSLGSDVPPRILTGHIAHVEQIVFSNTGSYLATTSRDHSIRLWNWSKLSDYPIVLNGADRDTWFWSAAFSPDDEQLMIAVHPPQNETVKPTIQVWPIRIDTMAKHLCGLINRDMTRDEWDNFVGSDLPYVKVCEK